MNKDVLPNRRKYNQWVANETLEDYSLRYTAKKSRRWSSGWVANTALGVVSFLALEAIGGAITLDYGFTNAMWAILIVGLIIFLSGIPLSFYAARDGVDIDLLTRGAGFGYIGSTISSLVYASFTFIFFALEAAIMSMALNMIMGMPLYIAYVLSALVIIPLATHGISRISLFQAWTQPVWFILQILPLIFISIHESSAFEQWLSFSGIKAEVPARVGSGFNILLFGSAAAVIFPLIAQNGEQADFLRFLPEKNASNKVQWWLAVIGAGPGWVIFGVIKLLIGSFLAVLALNHGILPSLASDPAHMYAMAFGYITSNPEIALWLTGLFVVISQLKINVTNAYAGSIAWGNFFSRLTHSHPGRVVWLFFNVAIALMLMELGLYQAFETVLITYGCLVVAWVGSVVADLVINKPLGLSPAHIEFRRGHLYDINPVGVISMLIASIAGISANLGIFGEEVRALAAFMSLLIPFVTVPLIAWLTQSQYYLCRHENVTSTETFASTDAVTISATKEQPCHVCENIFDQEDILHCPSYAGHICSLCCALDSRCDDQCRPKAHLSVQISSVFKRIFPNFINQKFHSMIGQFLAIFIITSGIIASLFVVVFYAQKDKSHADLIFISDTMWQIYFLLLIVTGILIWLYVLAQNSTRFALKETQLQTELLTREVEAHEETAIQLAKARDTADIANRAKSRYLSGVSHELRTPLNTIFGYAQLMEVSANTDPKNKKIASVIKRSSEHLSDVIEGLLEISKIEARKLDLHRDKVNLNALITQLEAMFQAQASAKNIEFKTIFQTRTPQFISVDEKRLRQVLLNLLSNAIKFTHQGKVELLINYRNQVAQFIIKDTGMGIAEADQERIFEPFERVSNTQPSSQTKPIPGTGLGLSISRLMIEMMGGNLTLKSQPDVGTEFILKLFLPSVSLSKTEEQQHLRQVQTDICGYTGQTRQIMVVDDESNHRNLMKDLLQPLGFRVVLAESAEQALLLLVQKHIDLFLLDISMPGINGWQLLDKLRQQGINEPIIILSADPYTKDQLQQHNTDIEAYINKPVPFEKLLEQLQTSLKLQWCSNDSDKKSLASDRKIQDEAQPLITANESSDNEDKWDQQSYHKILASLKGYAQIGYLKGVLDCIEQIETDATGPEWIKQLKIHSEQCNLNEIVRLIDENQPMQKTGKWENKV